MILNKNINSGKIGLDRRGFEALFRDNFKGLTYFAIEYVKDQDIAREIVQDAFAGLWEKRESIDTGKSPKSYLGSTVKNRCLNYLRDHKKFDRSILEFEGLHEGNEYIEQDHLVTNELKQKIESAMDSLPAKCREVFLKNRSENKKYQDIADEMQISVKTVEAQMSKALKIMREKLAEYVSILLLIIEFLTKQ